MKKHKKHITSESSVHSETSRQPIAMTIIMTVVITAAVLIAGYILYNALNKGSSTIIIPDDTTASGVVTIIEYSDFQCPFCKRGFETVKQLQATYGNKINVVFKQFPLNFHPQAQKAAEASLCAQDQNKFWPYHDMLFTNQDSLLVSDLKKYAADLNLDTTKFNTCLDSGEKAALVAADVSEGQKLGVTGTPTFVIGGEVIVGAQPFDVLKAAIDKASGGATNSLPVADSTKDDPIVMLTVINDATCVVCDPQRIVDITKQQLFPTAQIINLDKDDERAQKMIADMKLVSLPAYIFSSNIESAANFDKVSPALQKIGDSFVIAPGAAGPVRFLTPIEITGKDALGNDKAPVTIIEFSDFQCPYCKKFNDEVGQLLKTNYFDKGLAKMIFVQLPLESLHPNAFGAALASECAAEQNKFWNYHDALFVDQTKLSISDLKATAKSVGLDTAKFDECLDSQRYDALVKSDVNMAQSYGISGTPGFLVNGIFIGGALPYDEFAKIIDAELKAAKP